MRCGHSYRLALDLVVQKIAPAINHCNGPFYSRSTTLLVDTSILPQLPPILVDTSTYIVTCKWSGLATVSVKRVRYCTAVVRLENQNF